MLKIRLQGTKNDIRWFVRLLQREVSRKKTDSDKKSINAKQLNEQCHYVGSGMVIR